MQYDAANPSMQARPESAIYPQAAAADPWTRFTPPTTVAANHGPYTTDNRAPRTPRRRVAVVIIGVVAVALLACGAGIGWTLAHRDATAAKERLAQVQDELAGTTALHQACAATADEAKDVYQSWDEVLQAEAEWQAAKPSSPAERRIGAQLDRLYAALDGQIQAAKARSNSCPDSEST